MRVVVTGATGFVAGHLLPALAEAGHDVLALAGDPARVEPVDGVNVVECDLIEPLDAAPIGSFDAVVHLAQANVPFPDGARELFRVNAHSTTELLEFARLGRAERFVLASSGSVYGPREGPVTEDDPPRAVDFYSITKRTSELLVESYAPYLRTAAVLRLFTPYGPRQSGRLVPRLIERVRTGEPVTLHRDGRPRLTPIFVADVVNVILAALEREGAHVVNVAGDDTVGIRELAEIVAEAVGREPVFEQAETKAEGDVCGVNTRMRELYTPGPLVRLSEGLRATVEAAAVA